MTLSTKGGGPKGLAAPCNGNLGLFIVLGGRIHLSFGTCENATTERGLLVIPETESQTNHIPVAGFCFRPPSTGKSNRGVVGLQTNRAESNTEEF